MNGEDHHVTPIWCEHFDAQLHARAAVRQGQIPPFEILPLLAQEKRDLKRKDHLAV